MASTATGGPVSLRTDRLLLRPWRAGDLEPFAALNADPVTMEHFPSTLDRAASDALAGRIRAQLAEQGWGLWAVEVVGDPGVPFIGFVGLAPVSFLPGAVEVGWRLARAAWGRGYAPEGAAEAIRFGFEELGLDEIVSFTVPRNRNSRRVMEKVGMTHRPERDFDHPAVDPARHPELVRHVLYALDRDDRPPGSATGDRAPRR